MASSVIITTGGARIRAMHDAQSLSTLASCESSGYGYETGRATIMVEDPGDGRRKFIPVNSIAWIEEELDD